MSDFGWIKLHRSLIEHPRFRNGGWLQVWIYLLSKATCAEYRSTFGTEVIVLHPGQLITGREVIARACGLSDSKVERILTQLKTEQQIEQQSCSRGRLITIVNWDQYQRSEQQFGQQADSKRTAAEQQADTNKNGKKGENGKNATPLPPSHGKSEDEVETEKTSKGRLKGFDAFWGAYPKKIGRGAAEKAWSKVKEPEATLQTILSAIERQRQTDQWRKDGGQFIPNPATWINQRRWLDEVDGRTIPQARRSGAEIETIAQAK